MACRACGAASTSNPAGKTRLEAALRERLSALEVNRLDMVRGVSNENDAPPARLAFYSAPLRVCPNPRRANRWRTCCASNDASLRSVLVGLAAGLTALPRRWTRP